MWCEIISRLTKLKCFKLYFDVLERDIVPIHYIPMYPNKVRSREHDYNPPTWSPACSELHLGQLFRNVWAQLRVDNLADIETNRAPPFSPGVLQSFPVLSLKHVPLTKNGKALGNFPPLFDASTRSEKRAKIFLRLALALFPRAKFMNNRSTVGKSKFFYFFLSYLLYFPDIHLAQLS